MAEIVCIIDSDLNRRSRVSRSLREHGYEVVEATENGAITAAQHGKPDLVLIRVGHNLDLFHQIAEALPETFIVPFILAEFSPVFREEVLSVNADGFLNYELPTDELIASVRAFIRQKRAIDKLMRADTLNGMQKIGGVDRKSNPHETANSGQQPSAGTAPLRDRLPEFYQEVLRRYEEGVKLVLQHRIYKIDDDAFEPFRQIARELFVANATARDAVQLHYQTLRKIAPSPDTPRAKAYLEVGRTTIVGLLGDLLTFYRDAQRNNALTGSS